MYYYEKLRAENVDCWCIWCKCDHGELASGPTSHSLTDNIHVLSLQVWTHKSVPLSPFFIKYCHLLGLNYHIQVHKTVAWWCIPKVNSTSKNKNFTFYSSKFWCNYLTCIDLTLWRQHLWQQDMMWLYPWSGKLHELQTDLDLTKSVQMINLSAHSHQHWN